MGGTRATASRLLDGARGGVRRSRRHVDGPAKRWVCAWAALLVACSLAAGAAPATRPVDPDLYAWWRASQADAERAADAAGRSHAAKPLSGKLTIETVDGRTAFRVK